MKNTSWLYVLTLFVILGVGCCGCVTLGFLAARVPGAAGAFAGPPADAVAIVEVKGVIVSGKAPYGLPESGMAYSERVIQDLEAADGDPRVAAIVQTHPDGP